MFALSLCVLYCITIPPVLVSSPRVHPCPPRSPMTLHPCPCSSLLIVYLVLPEVFLVPIDEFLILFFPCSFPCSSPFSLTNLACSVWLLCFRWGLAIRRGGHTPYPKSTKGLKQALAACRTITRDAMNTHLKMVLCNGINIYKQLELWKNYSPIVDPECHPQIEQWKIDRCCPVREETKKTC